LDSSEAEQKTENLCVNGSIPFLSNTCMVHMLVSAQINILLNTIFKPENSYSKAFCFALKKSKHSRFSLNKSVHVHKKAKEHFVFYWPRKCLHQTPVFLDFISYNFYCSLFTKRLFSLNKTSQLFYKKKLFFCYFLILFAKCFLI
jgi:hypothetical protein